MRIQVLGPLRVWLDGDALDPGPPAQRTVLALLALAAGTPLSRAELIDGVWFGREPPPTAANALHTHVKNLRRLLEPDRVFRAPSVLLPPVGDGYALAFAGIDVLAFRQDMAAAAAAHRGGQYTVAAERLETALDRWHGPPLADLPALADHPRVTALAGERLAALGRYGAVMIAAGRAADGLTALEEVAATQPLDEVTAARLVQGYHAAGQRARAFAAFHGIRRRLADELGVAPGPELTAAHVALLRDEPREVSGPAPVPQQLPAGPPDFVGRAGDLARLDRLLEQADRPVIGVVSGIAGVGKSALAAHWAHRVAHRFPDGQLYVNLRGFDPSGTVVAPASAVGRFLVALGVPTDRVPADPEARTALYRSRTAGRRMLVLLDNARDPAQVRPLLPGSAGSLVLVTSRDQQVGLVAVDHARPVPVDPLDPSAGRDLLVRRIGSDRAAAEPAAVDEIQNHCAGLPLALAIVAARAATGPNLPLTALAEQLRRGSGRLDALSTGDPDSDLRGVFSWSYAALAPAAARLFRLLGLHPGPDLAVAAVASLAARPLAEVRDTLRVLARANLVVEHRPGRYTLHDLLRVYAADVAERVDLPRRRERSTRRLLDHLVHSGHAADLMLSAVHEPFTPDPAAPGVVPERFADRGQALAWFVAEHANLVGAVAHAGTTAHAWQLARVLRVYLDQHGHWSDLLATQYAAGAAARHLARPSVQAHIHRVLARAYLRLHRMDDAQRHLRSAAELYRELGDPTGQGHTELIWSLAWERRGEPGPALDHARRALEFFHEAGEPWGSARALNAIGWCHGLCGEYHLTLEYCRRALATLRELADHHAQASTWHSLGYAHHHLGDHAEAVACYREAIELYRQLGDRHLAGMALGHLGDTHAAAGAADAARAARQSALVLLDEVDRTAAEHVRSRL